MDYGDVVALLECHRQERSCEDYKMQYHMKIEWNKNSIEQKPVLFGNRVLLLSLHINLKIFGSFIVLNILIRSIVLCGKGNPKNSTTLTYKHIVKHMRDHEEPEPLEIVENRFVDSKRKSNRMLKIKDLIVHEALNTVAAIDLAVRKYKCNRINW
uniref:Uncharacterized protein n=1 Tax=Glossina austeni TaxID=7395 RepID=A0A1A9V7R4_GLOAU